MARSGEALPIRFVASKWVTRLADYQEAIRRFDQDPSVDIIFSFAPLSLIKNDGTISPVRDTIEWMALHQKKPGFTWMTDWVEYGYLASAGIDLQATGRTLAGKMVKVLSGIDPGEIPIDNPFKYSIAINRGRAELLGIEIPVELLDAAEVIYPGTSLVAR